MKMAGVTETSKPRRIKALLSSFLKGSSIEEKGKSDKELTDPSSSSNKDGAPSGGGDDPEGFVVIDEWTPTKDQKTRTVQPQNLDDFFGRVETFSTSKWFAKPEEVSPLHCARFGWENIHTDSIKCVSCKEVVYGGLPPKWEIQAYGKERQRLLDSLKDGHSKVCPWPSNPCPASFMEIPLSNREKVENAFRQRVASVRCFSTAVPAVDRSSMLQVNIEEAEMAESITRLVTGVLGEEPTRDYKDRIEAVVSIALCGWSRSSAEDSPTPSMMCEYCRRKVGLWNFTSVEESRGARTRDDDDKTDDSSEPATKKLKVDKGPFDPVGEHRTWCPWTKLAPMTSKFSSPAKGGNDAPLRPAWQQLLTFLLLRASPGSQGSDGMLTNKQALLKSLDNILGLFGSGPKKKEKKKKEDDERRGNVQA